MKKIGFAILIAFLLGCPSVSPVDDVQLNQSNAVYEALTGNKPMPPAELTVTTTDTKNGEVPMLSWLPQPKALSYNVYRKKGVDGEWTLLKTVSDENYYDDSINGAYYSGTYYYTVTSVDLYGRESFRPNAVAVALADPNYTAYATLLSVSQGQFAEVKEGATLIVPANKLGILLKIQADSDIEAWQIQHKPTSGGSWSIIAETFTPDIEAIQDAASGKKVYYFMHVPANQGVMYTYKLVPVKASGVIGANHPTGGDQLDGFVYPSAKVGKSDVQSYGGTCNIKVAVEGETGGATVSFAVKTSEEETGEFKALDENDFTLNQISSGYQLNLRETAIDQLIGDPLSKKVYFQVVAKYAQSGSTAVETVPSDTFLVDLIKKSAGLIELPYDITVTHGVLAADKTVTTPITISWAGTADPGIESYHVYRVNRLAFDTTDGTSWGSVVGTVTKTVDGSRHVFEDKDVPDCGGYFYKINPVGTGGVPRENNESEDKFVRAAMMSDTKSVVTASNQERETGIMVSWTQVSGATKYKLLVQAPSGGAFSAQTTGTAIKYEHSTTTPGEFTYRVVPLIEFINNGKVLETVECPASDDKKGAIKLSDTKWIKLVMQTMMQGQSTMTDRSTAYGNGGAATRENPDKTVTWGARGYQSYGENDKYQVFKFNNYTDANKSVSVDGILYHLYITRSGGWGNSGWKKGIGLYLSYSSSSDRWLANGYNNTDADNVDKQPGVITVTGVYPGELQIWAKNNVFNVNSWSEAETNLINAKNGVVGIVLIGDYSDWLSYAYCDWVKTAYGFITVTSDAPGINTSTAYSIKRSGQDQFKNYKFSDVGALQ